MTLLVGRLRNARETRLHTLSSLFVKDKNRKVGMAHMKLTLCEWLEIFNSNY